MDGTLAEWKAAKEPEDLYEKDYFLSLKPYQSVVEAAWTVSYTHLTLPTN